MAETATVATIAVVSIHPTVSFCYLIGYLLQEMNLCGDLFCQISAELPNTNCAIGFSHCKEAGVLTVEGQTGCGVANASWVNRGCWSQGPATQIEYLHLTWWKKKECL